MKLISRLKDHRYCAFCRSSRRVYLKKHVDMTNVLLAGLLAGTVTMSYWGQADPRGIMMFCVIIGVSELLVYLRWRLSIVCKMCGFDPVVYKRSPSEASRRVREFFTEQVVNPRFQLSNSPLLELHRRQRARERKRLELQSRLVRARTPMVDPKGP